MSKTIIENLAKMNIGRQEMINHGFSAQKYDDIQRGKSSYKLSDIINISEKFQLPLDYLVYGKEKSLSPELSNGKRELLELFDLLSEKEQGIIIGEMRAMAREHTEAKNAETA